jgi:hypothetical protein
MKFSMLNNFGGAYTLTTIDEESFIEIQLMQHCLVAQEKRQEMQSRKDTFYSKEGIMR